MASERQRLFFKKMASERQQEVSPVQVFEKVIVFFCGFIM